MTAAGARERDPAELAAEVIEAINARDPAHLRMLLDDRSQVITGRSTRVGPAEIVTWAGKEYDHLVRRFAIDSMRAAGGSVLATGSVQHVWTEGGGVADSAPIALELCFRGGLLAELRVHDDVAAALAAFDH